MQFLYKNIYNKEQQIKKSEKGLFFAIKIPFYY